MGSSTALYLFVVFFISLSLTITLAGVWASLELGTRPDGWSDSVAFALIIVVSATTLAGLYWLERTWLFMDGLGTAYGWLVLWYFFLFVIAQRWAVRVLRQPKEE
jgi:hypothetical protein